MVGTVGIAFVWIDADLVDGDASAEVYGIGANQIGVSLGATESVDMGVEAIAA